MTKNKVLIGIIILIIVLAGGVYMYKQSANQTSDDSLVNDSTGDNTSLSVPVLDGSGEGVEEMVVEGDDQVVPAVKEFQIDGSNFSFSLGEIKVNKGDKVRIVFNNVEGFHDLIIDEFNINTGQIKANESKTVEFVADKIGTFEYYCSVGQHRANGMFGQLIVE